MKTGKSLVRSAHYLCKVPTDSWAKRLIWWAFRKYLLNEDHWKIRKMFSGPRRDLMASYCLKADAVATRMYLEPRRRPPRDITRVIRLVDKLDAAPSEVSSGRRIDFKG